MPIDPTKTATLRKRASVEVNRRFFRLKKSVKETILDKESPLLVVNEKANSGRFIFMRQAEKVEEFNAYLQEEINREILFIEGGGEIQNHWLNVHVGAGYERGAKKARTAIERGIPTLTSLPDYSPFTNPFHLDRAELIFTRTYSDLKNVTNVMSAQMSRVLADGMISGKSPREIAKLMGERVDKIGRTRANLIARTEIIESHNQAGIGEAELLEKQTGVVILMKWSATRDGPPRERQVHRFWHGDLLTREEANERIGEPNCR